jgi:hypothetical protein
VLADAFQTVQSAGEGVDGGLLGIFQGGEDVVHLKFQPRKPFLGCHRWTFFPATVLRFDRLRVFDLRAGRGW